MQSDFYYDIYNPDVLNCLANLSNDEVFTPPEVACQMLDLLPQDLFCNTNTTFLDPVCKSGVFLREIAKRLLKGLEPTIPDLQTRIDHIFQKQLFGVAITELTSLLSRRGVYCSKYPNSIYSVSNFNNSEGNIRFKRIQHTWKNRNCIFCNASQDHFSDELRQNLETHAYELIHTTKPEGILNMKFDVIIGNPPYQINDGGAQKSASPLYHRFIQQAKKMNPRYISMIIPARWYAGGKGLDEFRNEMLNDKRIFELHDFPETADCFPGVNIRGGICYFLWDRSYNGDCRIVNHKNGKIIDEIRRPLLEANSTSFIRYNKAISILHKVKMFNELSFSELVSSSKPFGLRGFFDDYSKNKTETNFIKLYRFGEPGYIRKDQVLKNQEWISKIKVIVAEASPGSDDYPHLVLSKPFICEANAICTETYLVVGPFANTDIAKNVISYMYTRFFRFLIILIKNTQHTTKKVYEFVPIQDFSQPWTDELLYEKYKISEEEVKFIESLVKPLRTEGGNE